MYASFFQIDLLSSGAEPHVIQKASLKLYPAAAGPLGVVGFGDSVTVGFLVGAAAGVGGVAGGTGGTGALDAIEFKALLFSALPLELPPSLITPHIFAVKPDSRPPVSYKGLRNQKRIG